MGDSNHDLGYGVIARQAFSNHQLLTLYTGKLNLPRKRNESKQYPYGFEQFILFALTAKQNNMYKAIKKERALYEFEYNHTCTVDALEYGTIARFMQHFPTQGEISCMHLNQ